MASKIQSHNFYVAISPYKVQGVEDQYNELSVFTSYNEHVHQFYVSLHAGWKSTIGHGTMIMGDSNPLTASTRVYVKESPKNSQKTINEIGASLELAKDIIAALFDDREWDKLKVVVQNVARFGYVEQYKQQAEAYLKGRNKKNHESNESNESNNQTSEDKTMTENMKAADLIGKTIVVGNNQATIVIKSVDGDKLSGEFTKDGKTTPMSFPISQLQGMTEKGLWRIDNGELKIDNSATEVTTEADVQEVQDIVPVVKPRAKSDGGSKTADVPQTSDIKPQTSNKPAAIVKPMETKPKAKTNTNPTNQTNKPKPQTSYHVVLLPTKDGQKWPKLYGFKNENEAKKTAGKMAKTVTYSWDRDEQGEKRYYLKGGKKYCEVFQQLADALNAGNRAAIERACMASVAIFEGARSEKTNTNRANDTNATPHSQGGNKPAKTEKTYTAAEVVDLIQRMAKKDPKALAEYEAMLQAA